MKDKKIEVVLNTDRKTEAKPKKIEKSKGVTKEEAKAMLINYRDFVRSEFKRFGFEETSGEDWVEWKHDGEKDISTITIYQDTNSISLKQKKLVTKSNMDYQTWEEWETIEFGIMDPLFSIIGKAMDAYFISINTRGLNDKWTHSNIIPGTNGDGK